MTRPSDPGFDVRISDWLEADPNLAPPDLMRTVESALPSIPQRRVLRLPWRFPPMSTFAKVAVAAVAVIAIGAVGMFALQPRSVPAVGTAPTASPSPSPSSTATPVPTPPPLNQSFTAPGNDIAISYPAAWTAQPATAPWTAGWPNFGEPFGNYLYDPALTDHLFIALASQPLAGTPGDQWATEKLAGEECGVTEPVTIDGASGLVGTECDIAAVSADGTGYLVMFYRSGDEAWLETTFDRAWYEQLLQTIDLQPEPAASAPPSP